MTDSSSKAFAGCMDVVNFLLLLLLLNGRSDFLSVSHVDASFLTCMVTITSSALLLGGEIVAGRRKLK